MQQSRRSLGGGGGVFENVLYLGSPNKHSFIVVLPGKLSRLRIETGASGNGFLRE